MVSRQTNAGDLLRSIVGVLAQMVLIMLYPDTHVTTLVAQRHFRLRLSPVVLEMHPILTIVCIQYR